MLIADSKYTDGSEGGRPRKQTSQFSTRSNSELDTLCRRRFDEAACQDAYALLAQRPWTTQKIDEACKHLNVSSVWSELAQSTFGRRALLYQRGRIQNGR